MARIAIHITLREGMSEVYRDLHERVPRELEDACRESGVVIEAYSIFEQHGHVFGFLGVDDAEDARGDGDHRDRHRWGTDLNVDGPLADEDGLVWMDEVYRMV